MIKSELFALGFLYGLDTGMFALMACLWLRDRKKKRLHRLPRITVTAFLKGGTVFQSCAGENIKGLLRRWAGFLLGSAIRGLQRVSDDLTENMHAGDREDFLEGRREAMGATPERQTVIRHET